MWERKDLKRRGKRQLGRNWLATVAVCFLLAFTGAEFVGSTDFIHQFDPAEMLPGDQVVVQQVDLSNWEMLLQWLDIDPMDGTHPMWAAANQSVAPLFDTLTAPFSAFFALLERSQFAGWLDILLAVAGIAGGLWFSIWVLGALTVGARRFLLESRVRDNISIAAMFTPFARGNWWNVTKGTLLRSVYLILWTCTVVGFPIKFYAYRMVPYILAENPQIKPREAILLSRQMMDGQKWRCFLLDLTFFLHWSLLPTIAASLLGLAVGLLAGETALIQFLPSLLVGLLSLLFVNGYRSATYTELYVVLRRGQLEGDAPLAQRFTVPEFGEEPPQGEKPRLADKLVRPPEDPVFHFVQRHKLNYNQKYPLRTLILLFFAFSFVGWLWEVSLHIVTQGMLINRGTMLGPWLPIYGAGGVLVLLLLRRLFTRPAATFLVSMVLCSIVEYFASWFLEMSYGIRWWDYSGYFMNLNGRICLEGAVTFGLACCIVVYFAAPLLGAGIARLSPAKQTALCAVLLALFGADLVYSHFHPNAGTGITDYDDWKQAEGGAASALPEDTGA